MNILQILPQLEADVLALFAAVAVVVLLISIGALFVNERNGGPAVAVGVGIGAVAFSFTVFGTLTKIDFRWVTAFLVVCSFAGFSSILRQKDRVSHFRLIGLIFLSVLVLLLIVSPRQASEWDEFSHWLHAMRYLIDFHQFPGRPNAPEIFSCCAAYPYGWPLLVYLGHFISGIKESLPALINILLLGLFGGLLARLSVKDWERPSFAVICVGVLFATVLSPTFVSKLVFSSYADCVTAFLLGVGCYLVVRVSAALFEQPGESTLPLWLSLGLIGCAIISAKPANLVLYLLLLIGLGALVLRRGAWRNIRVDALLAIALPLLVYILWRQYVWDYLIGQEMAIRRPEDWNLHLLPAILARAFGVMAKKGYYFIVMLFISIAAVRSFWRCKTELDQILIVVAVLFLGFNAFLIFTYVSVFGEFDALRVASFWRYNTQLGLTATLVVAIVSGKLFLYLGNRWSWTRSRLVSVLPIAGVIAAPFAAIESIRFDINPTKTFYRDLLSQLPDFIPEHSRIAIYDPAGTGLGAVMATYEWNDKLELSDRISAFNKGVSLDEFRKRSSSDLILVISGQGQLDYPIDEPVIALLKWDGGWQTVVSFRYPDERFPSKYP